jgi:hypothetical protein
VTVLIPSASTPGTRGRREPFRIPASEGSRCIFGHEPERPNPGIDVSRENPHPPVRPANPIGCPGEIMPAPDRSAALRYAIRDIGSVEGWVSESATTATLLLAQAQDRAAVAGDIAEIGIHHGKYFILLAQFLNPGETGLAIDLFGRQAANLDGSGHGDLDRFRQNLTTHLGPDPAVVVLEADSLSLTTDRLGARAFRMVSIDGGHTAAHVLNDLALFEPVLHEHGFVVVDDFYNPAWPGVNEGMFRYWLTGGALRPFAYGGNKLYLCRPSAWEAYWTATEAFEAPAIVNRIVRLVGMPCRQVELQAPGRVFALPTDPPEPGAV